MIGYTGYQYAIIEGRTMFRFSGLVGFLPFGDLVESELRRELAEDHGVAVEPAPGYLLSDESETESWEH